MPELQTSYNENISAAYPGMVASGATSNRISRTVEDAAGIVFGAAVFRGSGDHGTTATPTAGTDLGFAIATDALALLPGQTADVYPQYENMAIMTEGEIFVASSVAVADGDQVYVTPAKAITNTSNSSANITMTGWKFDQTLAAAGTVKIAKR